MSNTNPNAEATEATPEGVASRIVTKLETVNMPWASLSHRTGIPYDTLRDQLRTNPRSLTVRNLLLIAEALGVSVAFLAVGA